MSEKFKTDHPGTKIRVLGVNTYELDITMDAFLGSVEKSVADCYTIETDERLEELVDTLLASSDEFLLFLAGIFSEALPAKKDD